MTYSYDVAKRALLEGVVTPFSMALVKCLHSWRQSFSSVCSPCNDERSGAFYPCWIDYLADVPMESWILGLRMPWMVLQCLGQTTEKS